MELINVKIKIIAVCIKEVNIPDKLDYISAENLKNAEVEIMQDDNIGQHIRHIEYV